MGADKALLRVGAHTLAEGVATALTQAGATAVVTVGGDQAALTALGLRWIPDLHPGEGPLGGIISALHHVAEQPVGDPGQNDLLIVAPCDLLEPRAVDFTALVGAVEAADVTFACVDGRVQYMVGAWQVRSLPLLAAAYSDGHRSIRSALDHLDVQTWNAPRAMANDADTPDDLPGD